MLTIKLTNTSAGLIAIQRALAGEDITFTKLDIGDGVLTNLDISDFTSVINKIKDYPLGVVKQEGQEMVRLRANINNVGITEDKAIREFGLYAKFGSSEQEFLFAYMNTGDIPTALPSSSGGRYDLNRDFVMYIGNSTNVSFDYNADLVFATLKDHMVLEAKKEDKIEKNEAFNKNFGVVLGEVLEGHRMAQSLGVEKFGGDVQTAGTKKVGYAYWCTVNKDMYICKVENSLNYIDAAYFEAFSNNALLGKLNNLIESYSESIGGYLKYADGSMEAWMILEIQTPIEGSDSYFPGMNSKNTFVPNTWGVVASPYPTSDSPSFRYTVKGTYLGFWNANGNKMFFKAIGRWK
ncbi:MAG: hypothetical protein ACRCY7_03375 [Cetobacterium sp.]|uniref:hypothetical protein n=1 Tax=Cetobacterium sp. TaxID=2071632 RepID=UPI003F2B6D01